MKTWEIWKMMDEDFESVRGKKFKLINPRAHITKLNKGDVAEIGRSMSDEGLFHEGPFGTRLENLTGFEEWEEVKEPVSFLEAVKSGKKIRAVAWMQNTELDLPNLLYDISDFDEEEIRQLLLDYWYIED